MVGKSVTGDECAQYIETVKVDKYDLSDIDLRNKQVLEDLEKGL
jgi:hypothetical protein